MKKSALSHESVHGETAPCAPRQLSILDLADSVLAKNLMPEHEFKAALAALIPEPSRIVLTHNRSSLISVQAGKDGAPTARIQHAFRAADKKTMKALARFIQKADKRSGKKIDAFLRENRDLLEAMAREPNQRPRNIARGRHYNLKNIMKKVMRDHGLRLSKIEITWSARPRKQRRRSSIKFGSFCYSTRTIAVHPDLDNPLVPDYFVEYIVYHELLHALFPPVSGNNRRRAVHTREFKRFERKFNRFEEALKFENVFMETRMG